MAEVGEQKMRAHGALDCVCLNCGGEMKNIGNLIFMCKEETCQFFGEPTRVLIVFERVNFQTSEIPGVLPNG
jgi:hypothetical protein